MTTLFVVLAVYFFGCWCVIRMFRYAGDDE